MIVLEICVCKLLKISQVTITVLLLYVLRDEISLKKYLWYLISVLNGNMTHADGYI